MSAVAVSISRFCSSSIGRKVLVALTGGVFVLFVLGHMLGNLQVFLGPEMLNSYAHKLQSLGPILWLIRIFLLVTIAVHIVLTIQLTRENRRSRESRYGKPATIVATKPSRIMIWSGLTVLAFIVFHILHLTACITHPDFATFTYDLHGEQVPDVYKRVVVGFSSLPVSVFYIIAMLMLSNHLVHGVSSMFQTLGLATEKNWPLLQKAGIAYALLILIGNCSIPIAILCGFGR